MSKDEILSWQDKNDNQKKKTKKAHEPENEKEALLGYMARRAAGRSFFLASALESFQRAENLDETGLLKFLEIEPGQLSRLALCGRPDVADKTSFAHDVNAIANKFNLKPMLLAKLLRTAAAYEASREAAPTQNNFLMAALDREIDDEFDADADTETKSDD